MDSEQSLPSALGHPGGLACQVPGRAWLRPPRTRTGRLALTPGRVACQRHPIPRHEIGSENRCRWTLRMCMASHICEYTQQTTHRVATNTTRRPLFHRAPEDEDDRGAHSKAKEFILGISVCCLCFLKSVNLDLGLDGPEKACIATKSGYMSYHESVCDRVAVRSGSQYPSYRFYERPYGSISDVRHALESN